MNKNISNILQNPYVQYAILASIMFVIVFLKIGSFHMRYWDESMFAVNTYEMMESGQYFSLYFEGRPDLFNTKPPLMNWLQLIFAKIFGYNELAMRLPSALATAGSVLMLFRFTRKHLGTLWAWVSSLILLSTTGYIGYHTARTGDSDALLSFFALMMTLAFFNFMLTEKRRYILFASIFLTLAFATKLYAAFMFLPAYLIILLYAKKLKSFVINWYFVLGLLIFFISVFGLIYMREIETPGYVHEILFKDAGRLFSVVENHAQSVYFYLDSLFTDRYSFWILLFLLGCVLVLFNKELKGRSILIYSLISILSYFLIITFSVTKLVWYDMPLYPLMALITAYPIIWVIKRLREEYSSFNSIGVMGIIVLFFFYPLFLMFRQSQDNTIFAGDKIIEANELYLFDAYKQGKDLQNVKVYYHGWNGSLLFYKYKFGLNGQNIELSRVTHSFETGDRILVSKDSLKEVVRTNFNTEVIDRYESSELLLIK